MTVRSNPSKEGSTSHPPTLADWLNVSHELRTPANAILGHVELLLSGTMGPLSAETRASLGHIQEAGHHLLVQIDQAISIGQTLPYCDHDSSDVGEAIRPL